MNLFLLFRATPLGFLRQDLRRGTGSRVTAACAAPSPGSDVADHSINDQPHDDCKNNADNNRRDHLSLSPPLLRASKGCQPLVMGGK